MNSVLRDNVLDIARTVFENELQKIDTADEFIVSDELVSSITTEMNIRCAEYIDKSNMMPYITTINKALELVQSELVSSKVSKQLFHIMMVAGLPFKPTSLTEYRYRDRSLCQKIISTCPDSEERIRELIMHSNGAVEYFIASVMESYNAPFIKDCVAQWNNDGPDTFDCIMWMIKQDITDGMDISDDDEMLGRFTDVLKLAFVDIGKDILELNVDGWLDITNTNINIFCDIGLAELSTLETELMENLFGEVGSDRYKLLVNIVTNRMESALMDHLLWCLEASEYVNKDFVESIYTRILSKYMDKIIRDGVC